MLVNIMSLNYEVQMNQIDWHQLMIDGCACIVIGDSFWCHVKGRASACIATDSVCVHCKPKIYEYYLNFVVIDDRILGCKIILWFDVHVFWRRRIITGVPVFTLIPTIGTRVSSIVLIVLYHDILWFQVAMVYSSFMAILDDIDQLQNNILHQQHIFSWRAWMINK